MSRSRLELAYRLGPGTDPRSGFRRVVWNGHVYAARIGYRLTECQGACQNPFNDHCMSCAPNWGVKAIPDD